MRVNTDSFALDHRVSINILSGKESLYTFLNAKWVVTKAILSNLDTLKDATWCGKPYIVCLDVDSGVTSMVQSMGVNQWRTVMRLKVVIGLDAEALTEGEIGV